MDAKPENYYHMQNVFNRWHDKHPEYTIEGVAKCVERQNEQGTESLEYLINAMEGELEGKYIVEIKNGNYTIHFNEGN